MVEKSYSAQRFGLQEGGLREGTKKAIQSNHGVGNEAQDKELQLRYEAAARLAGQNPDDSTLNKPTSQRQSRHVV